MHLLMSFVGSVGVLMAGSGLEEILMSTLRGVQHMLTGKKLPQNTRALRMLSEEIIRDIKILMTMMTGHVYRDYLYAIRSCTRRAHCNKVEAICFESMGSESLYMESFN